MLRVFEIKGTNLTTVSAVVTLAFINPPAAPGVGIRILRVKVSYGGAATSAQQQIQFVSQPTTFPTLISVTPSKVSQQDSVSVITGATSGAAGTCGVNASAEGAGSKVVLKGDAFNVLIGFEWVATPNEVYEFPAGTTSGFGVYFPIAPASTNPWQVNVVYQEY